jgi:hypothetical protein
MLNANFFFSTNNFIALNFAVNNLLGMQLLPGISQQSLFQNKNC